MPVLLGARGLAESVTVGFGSSALAPVGCGVWGAGVVLRARRKCCWNAATAWAAQKEAVAKSGARKSILKPKIVTPSRTFQKTEQACSFVTVAQSQHPSSHNPRNQDHGRPSK